jgi:hypothetical protein
VGVYERYRGARKKSSETTERGEEEEKSFARLLVAQQLKY